MNIEGKSPGSRLEILKAISDAKSLMLLNSIAKGYDTDIEVRSGNLFSRKEYYSRIAKFIKTGMVTRRRGKCLLTPFGEVIYEVQLMLAEEINSIPKINRNRINQGNVLPLLSQRK